MRIAFWGVRGSIPVPHSTHLRYGGNTACVAVFTESNGLFIFDAGSGIRGLGQELLALAGNQPTAGCLLLSHFHWDHIMGLPFFQPLYRANSHFSFISMRHPESSLQELLEVQMSSPYFPVCMSELPGQREYYEVGEQSFSIGDARVTTRRVNHPQGCLGFRLESGGSVITYATDHEPDNGPMDRNVIELAFGADVLILDAQYSEEEYQQGHRGWGHGTWEGAVRLARSARARQLVLFHHDPDRNDVQLREIEEKARLTAPCVVAAYEGLEIELEEQSRAIAVDPVFATFAATPLHMGPRPGGVVKLLD